MSLSLKSSAFKNGDFIPRRYTGEGEDVSPPLTWSHVPEGTHEFVLICEDPDAPGEEPFVHWIVYNLSPNSTLIPEGLTAKPRVEAPIRADQGVNSFGNIGYGGPMPPEGHGKHRYFFKLYALDTELGVPPGASKAEVLRAMSNHVIAEATLVGTYERMAQKRRAA